MRHPRIFYGWWVVAASFFTVAIFAGVLASFGVFFKPLEAEFNWSRSLVSSGVTTFLVGYALSSTVTGIMSDRYNPRLILLISAILGGLGLALCRLMTNADQYRFLTLMAGLGAGSVFSVPAPAIQRWFHNRRGSGIALSLIMSGFGIGQMVFTPLVNQLINQYGWRNGFAIIGAAFFIIVFSASFIIKSAPPEILTEPRGASTIPPDHVTWNTGQALKTRAFGSILFASCALIMALQTITLHFVARTTDVGIDPTLAAVALGIMGGLSVPGRLGSSLLARRLGWSRTMSLPLLGLVPVVVWLAFLNTTGMMWAFVILFGSFWGIAAVAQWGVLIDYFGLHSLGALTGIISGISNLLGAVAPFFAGFVFDVTGNYNRFLHNQRAGARRRAGPCPAKETGA